MDGITSYMQEQAVSWAWWSIKQSILQFVSLIGPGTIAVAIGCLVLAVLTFFTLLGAVKKAAPYLLALSAMVVAAGCIYLWWSQPVVVREVPVVVESRPPVQVDFSGLNDALGTVGNAFGDAFTAMADAVPKFELPTFELPNPEPPSPEELERREAEGKRAEAEAARLAKEERKREEKRRWRRWNAGAPEAIDQWIGQNLNRLAAEEAARQAEMQRRWMNQMGWRP